MASNQPAAQVPVKTVLQQHTLTGDEQRALAARIDVMMQDNNGNCVYSNERAMVGYIEAAKYLLIPQDTHDRINGANEPRVPIDVTKLGSKNGIMQYANPSTFKDGYTKANPYLFNLRGDRQKDARDLESMKIACLNYVALKDAGLDDANAFVAAALRARWIITGAYHALVEDKATTFTEVRTISAADTDFVAILNATTPGDAVLAMGGHAKSFYDAFKSGDYGAKWVTMHAENLWAAVEHCFRVRSHHFKTTPNELDSYVSLYTRYMEAAFPGDFAWPKEVDMFAVFHTAIHPFKIRALPVMVAHYTAHNKIANSAIIRMSGAPCGNAALTTAHAAMATLKGESWWTVFEKTYADSLAEVNSFNEAIISNKYGFHISAGLYGVTKVDEVLHNKVTYTMDQAKQSASLIGAAAQGVIMALRQAKKEQQISKFALDNAMALEKPASHQPLLATKIASLVVAGINAVSEASSINDAIAAALPTGDVTNANSTATGATK